MPKTMKESVDSTHLPDHGPVYRSSGARTGESDQRWGQGPAAIFTFRTKDRTFRASETGVYLSSSDAWDADALAEEMEAWQDAAADAFWLIEGSLEDEA